MDVIPITTFSLLSLGRVLFGKVIFKVQQMEVPVSRHRRSHFVAAFNTQPNDNPAKPKGWNQSVALIS